MANDIGNYARHAQYWDWSGEDRTKEHEYWTKFAKRFGNNVLIPMCAWGETGAYMAERGMNVLAFDITPEMIAQGKSRFGNLPGLRLLEGDVRDFRFDSPPADFCYSTDFSHIQTMEEIKRALVCIHTHLRDGGCLVIETGLRAPDDESSYTPLRSFYPLRQVYPNIKVWKTGETRKDAESGRTYISQTFYAEDENGNVESFNHAFTLQAYSREEWLTSFKECGYDVVGEYPGRGESWPSVAGGFCIFEALKSTAAKNRYTPSICLDHLQTPIYQYENVSLYNDLINLEQPNSGYHQFYRFDIRADGNWVGGIHVWIGYSIRIHYSGQIGFTILEHYRNRGYMTKACLALLPFLRRCGYKHVLITTDENNVASRRVCEKIGAVLLETVDTPTWSGLYSEGQRRTCIYEWSVEQTGQQDAKKDLIHLPIDLETDADFILERHCRINYACDTPWARTIPYADYRKDWFRSHKPDQFLGALRESMEDKRTIAEIIKAESGEITGYLWVPFRGEDAAFMWADVQDLYVEEPYRKTGIAAYLMDYAEQRARQNRAAVIRSGTGCENTRSQGLHLKMGYYQYRMEYEKVLSPKEE